MQIFSSHLAPPLDQHPHLFPCTCHLSTQGVAHLQFSLLPAFPLQNQGLSQFPMKYPQVDEQEPCLSKQTCTSSSGVGQGSCLLLQLCQSPPPKSDLNLAIKTLPSFLYFGPGSKYYCLISIFSKDRMGICYAESCLELGHPTKKHVTGILQRVISA